MKKESIILHLRRCVIAIFAILVGIPVFSQSAILPGGYQHVIWVCRYSNYGKGYLTIVDPGFIEYSKDKKNWTKEYITHEYVGVEEDKKLYRGCLILEVDGVSAKGWTEEDFYRRVDGRKDVITLKIRERHFPDGIREFETKIRPRYELSKDLMVFGDVIAYQYGPNWAQRRTQTLGSSNVLYEERSDDDFDFFNCMFYDIRTTDDDPLLEKELVKQIGLLERNTEKPDIILRVKKNYSVNHGTEYVPSTYRDGYHTVNGSVTTYKKLDKPGYNRNVTAIGTYLEISAYDSKGKTVESVDSLPVVWTTVAQRHTSNGNYNPVNDLKAYASWMTLPIADKFVNVDQVMFAPTGIITEADPFIIKEVIPGSRAERLGLQPGDKLVKASTRKPTDFPGPENRECKRRIKEKGWNAFNGHLESRLKFEMNPQYFDIVFSRDGKKIKLQLDPVSVYIKRYYVGG